MTRKKLFCICLMLLLSAVVLDRVFPPDLSRLEAVGTEVVDRKGQLLAVLPAIGGVWRFRTSPDDVDADFLARLIETEDRHFWHHPGVNPLALARAAGQDARAGRIVSGGSTITMQVARLLHPRPRTVLAKLIEAARAVQLEWRFGKRDILGMWLTLAPYGGNLSGVQAGALAWFGTDARRLEPAQAALLVAIARRPEAFRPDRHPNAARALRDRILHADGGALPDRRSPMPRHAVPALPKAAGARLVTTLDLGLQTALERVLTERAMQLPERTAVAALIADVGTRDILALDASPWIATAGAADLTRAVRSPGSALKPFIYGMAFEAGFAGPETLLDDLPRHFGAYAPENFEQGFEGHVSMAEALRRSLNLPAVALLAEVGPRRFLTRLRGAGVDVRLPPGADPSLPLALGGAGLTLRDLAALYAGLAGDAVLIPLHLVPGRLDSAAPAVRAPLLSTRAAGVIAGILTQNFPDGGPAGIAWKTGTSWGGRDAWAIGFDTRHVAAVWVGRPDGTALPGATGRSLAVPVLARLFALLPPAPRPEPPFVAGRPARATSVSDSLRLLFPPPGATLDATSLQGGGTITLRAMGGRRPLTFLIDGVPLATDAARREAGWSPPADGFYRLTVLDADGKAVTTRFRVQPAGSK